MDHIMLTTIDLDGNFPWSWDQKLEINAGLALRIILKWDQALLLFFSLEVARVCIQGQPVSYCVYIFSHRIRQ